jgi:hypothetical protein
MQLISEIELFEILKAKIGEKEDLANAKAELEIKMLLLMSMSHFIPSLKCHIFPSINSPRMVFRWSPLFISNLYCW